MCCIASSSEGNIEIGAAVVLFISPCITGETFQLSIRKYSELISTIDSYNISTGALCHV